MCYELERAKWNWTKKQNKKNLTTCCAFDRTTVASGMIDGSWMYTGSLCLVCELISLDVWWPNHPSFEWNLSYDFVTHGNVWVVYYHPQATFGVAKGAQIQARNFGRPRPQSSRSVVCLWVHCRCRQWNNPDINQSFHTISLQDDRQSTLHLLRHLDTSRGKKISLWWLLSRRAEMFHTGPCPVVSVATELNGKYQWADQNAVLQVRSQTTGYPLAKGYFASTHGHFTLGSQSQSLEHAITVHWSSILTQRKEQAQNSALTMKPTNLVTKQYSTARIPEIFIQGRLCRLSLRLKWEHPDMQLQFIQQIWAAH